MAKARSKGSEPAVPNGSELELLIAANQEAGDPAGTPRVGRPPVLDDDALDALTEELRRKAGRLPSLDQLIDAAGGCQRQRASKALKRARVGVAEKDLQGLLRIPVELENAQRRWIAQWLSAAAGQLAELHAELMEKHQEKLEALEALVSEQHQALVRLREQKADLERVSNELLRVREQDRASIERLTAERDIAVSLARA